MRTEVRLSKDFMAGYRRLLRLMDEAGDPPCAACSDSKIMECARTDYQCMDFIAYAEFIREGLRMSGVDVESQVLIV